MSKITSIYQDLIKIDPSLIPHEQEIMKALKVLLSEKPDTKFDAKFAANLKAKLMAESAIAPELTRSKWITPIFEAFRSRMLKGALAGLVVLMLAGGGVYYGRSIFTAPTVIAGNWDFNYKKIPYNVPSIDITMSTSLKAESVTKNSVKITPFVPGTPELKDGNIVSYKLEKPLEIGKFYTLELGESIESRIGKSLWKSVLYEIEAVGAVAVSRMIPTSTTTGLFKNPLVVFNIPVIPQSSLGERDKLSCPIEFTPALKGRCTWPSSNIMEYRLDEPMQAATRYDAKVQLAGAGFLYPMQAAYTGSISTTPLIMMVGQSTISPDAATNTKDEDVTVFSPSRGVLLRFSAPVAKGELKKFLKISRSTEAVPTVSPAIAPVSGASIPYNLVSSDNTEIATEFRVFGTSEPLEYSAQYTIDLAKWLLPAYGNLPLENPKSLSISSVDLLESMAVQAPNYSATGVLESYSDVYASEIANTLPSRGAKININLAEEIELTPGSIRFEFEGLPAVACNIKYLKKDTPESDWSLKMVPTDDKRRVECTPADELPVGKRGNLVFQKSLSAGLKTDYKREISVAPKFTIDTFELESPTRGCFYSTTPIGSNTRGITLSNRGKILHNYSSNSETCPSRWALYGTYSDVRFTPNMSSQIKASPELRDMFGQTLERAFEKSVTVGAVGPEDRYLYTTASRDIQTIPSNLPVVVGLQSVNTTSAKIEICELDERGYMDYLTRQYTSNYNPICISTTPKDITTKNLNWDLSITKFDIAEFLGRPIASNFVLVRGSALEKFNIWYEGSVQSNREFRTMYLRQNLALALVSGDNSKMLATSLDGKTLPSDLVFSHQDARPGFVFTPPKWNPTSKLYEGGNDPDVLIARNKDFFGIITRAQDANSNYDHGVVGWAEASATSYTFLSSDRPIYRAGDSLSYKGILRELTARGYKLSTAKYVRVRALSDLGDELFRQDLTVDKNSTFTSSFVLPKEMKTGRYSFEITTVGDKASLGNTGVYSTNDANFFVEQYVKPVFKINFADTKRDVLAGDTVTAEATAEYYFWGVVPGARANWSVMAQSYFFDAKDYSGYTFGTDSSYIECRYWGICATQDRNLLTLQNTLSALGTTKQSVLLEGTGSEELITYNLEVTDPNTARTVRGSTTRVKHITDGYVGIMSPYWVNKNDPIKFEGVLLDYSVSPRDGVRASVEIARVEYKSAKKQGVDWAFYEEYERVETLETIISVKSSGDGKFSGEFAPKTGGSFVVRAKYTGPNKQSFVSETNTYVETESNPYWNLPNNSTTTMTAEKSVLKPGETASLTFKSPINSGRMLVTVEKDSTILEAYSQEITSFTPRIEVKIQDSYIPNIYVRAYIIGRDGQNLPVYKRALAALKVLPDSMKLGVEVTTPKNGYLPGESLKVSVMVKDANGKPLAGGNGSLTVVDESVLALLGNPLKNPFAFFYEMKRYLGTTLYLSLTNLVEKLEVKNTGNGEKWGAGEGNKWGDTKKKRGIFKDTAFYQANFMTDANGRAEIDVGILPDNLTTWAIESIVSSASTQIGIGRTSITTAKRVMINDNIPRILRTGDMLKLSPVVFNRTGKDSNMSVEFSGNGVTGATKKSVFLKNGESKTVNFEVRANSIPERDQVAYATIRFKAIAEATNEQDEVEKMLPVTRSEGREVTATIGRTKGTSFDEQVSLVGLPKDRTTLTVTTAATLIGNALSGIDSLMHYPYGCVEQRTSAALPIALGKGLATALGQPYDLSTRLLPMYDPVERIMTQRSEQNTLEDYRASLLSFEAPSGGLKYWKEGNSFADFAMTAYVVRNSPDFAAAGVPLNAGMLSRNLDYLTTRLAAGDYEGCYGPCPLSLTDKLRAIAALGYGGRSDQAIRFWRANQDTKRTLSGEVAALDVIAGILTSKWVVWAEREALTKTARAIAEKIVKTELVYDPRGAYLSTESDGSRVFTTASFISRVTDLGLESVAGDEILENLTRFLARSKKSDGSYWSTQETVAVLRALTTRAAIDKKSAGDKLTVWANLNGSEVLRNTFAGTGFTQGASNILDIKALADRSTLNFGLIGSGRAYYNIELAYPVPATEIVARDEGFFISTEYYDAREYARTRGEKADEYAEYQQGRKNLRDLKYPKDIREYLKAVKTPKVGQLLTVECRIITGEDRDYVALESLVPSGTEVVNTRLATETQVGADKVYDWEKPFGNEDFRDDRYFAYAQTLRAGDYTGSFTIRVTHAGEFMIPPTRVFEFNTPEVFGQTAGKEMKVGE